MYFQSQNMSRSAAIIKPVSATRRAARPARKKGQTLVEYAIVLALISVMAMGVFTALGSRIVLIFSSIDNILDTAQSPLVSSQGS